MFPKPKRRVSTRRQMEREYTRRRRAFLQQYSTCAVCRTARATQVHHRAGRQGKRLIDTNLFLPVCHACHVWIHANPEASYERGWLVRINTKA